MSPTSKGKENDVNVFYNWIELLADALKQLGSLLQGQRPALQPVPIRTDYPTDYPAGPPR